MSIISNARICLSADITPDTRMVLLNAVYFKGNWAKKFEKEGTSDRTFYLNEKSEKKVPTMFVKGDFVYGELPDLKAKFVELPYEVIYLFYSKIINNNSISISNSYYYFCLETKIFLLVILYLTLFLLCNCAVITHQHNLTIII